MKHLGDITKINGAEIEIVDVITGGSPCQDLSIAGKRAGLTGARSGLFMEQVRIVKEMREHDRNSGRTGDMVRPRFMVWENVPGAFSSNKGRDFAAVLEEIIRIAEPEAPDIEVPEKGWPTWGGYHDEVGGRWSVAWRVHDAQYWGVPQRRRRISVVADFGGDTAGEILFERKSVSGHPAESGAARERLAGNAENGASYAVRIRGGCDGGGKGALVQEDKSGTLGTGNDQTIFCLQGNGIDRADTAGCNGKGWREDTSYTLNTIDRPAVCAGFKLGNSEQARSIGYAEEQSPTLNAECGGNKPAVMCLNDQGGNVMGVSHDVSGTLRAQEHGHQPSVLDMSHACDVIRDCGEIAPSLQARMGTGGNQVPLTYQDVTGTLSPGAHAGSYNGQDAYNDMLVCGATPDVAHTLRAKANCAYREDAETYPVQNMVVRRLTPMECERLQGFPDGWTDIGEWMDSKGKRHKDADSPRYKALGNSIALPFWNFLAKRISAQYLRPVTMGSLFDGIGGFPLVFERHNGNGTARWASEIEEFPIAVTKKWFGEE
jgi:DNA (cytosine-5)-methyltransferase 1